MPFLVGSTTRVALGFAIGTAVIALLVAALVAIALLRRKPDRKLSETSVAVANPRPGEIMSDLSEALERADEVLYQAKEEGKSRAVNADRSYPVAAFRQGFTS